MTDPTGRSFLSYRRTRIADARLLIEAQHDVGIPTWQDLEDLDEGHTDEQLREVLASETTANALCWLTPDVEHSATITRTELPCIVKRVAAKDSFFTVPVAAAGADYGDVTRIVGSYVGADDLRQWNVTKVSSDPLANAEAALVAKRILKHRIRKIADRTAAGTALRLVLNTRKKPAFELGVALTLDWTHRFNGRTARSPADWTDYLLPALETVARSIEQYAPGRPLVVDGLCGLPAAVGLGGTFLSTRRLPLTWVQVSPTRTAQEWSLSAPREPSGFTADVKSADVAAEDLALLVCVTSDAEPAFAASRANLPAFRATIRVTKPEPYPHDIATAGQAADIVGIISEALHRARQDFQPRGKLHLFLAVPAGLAVMIGQTLNTFGPVQTYEHIAGDSVGHYEPAVLLTPSVS